VFAVIFSSAPLVSVGVLASTSIAKLDAILAWLCQQTHDNLQILISGGAVPGSALINHLHSKPASDARIKNVLTQNREFQVALASAMTKLQGR
jgi:hypothetical protein